jgi:hypothetical protein
VVASYLRRQSRQQWLMPADSARDQPRRCRDTVAGLAGPFGA